MKSHEPHKHGVGSKLELYWSLVLYERGKYRDIDLTPLLIFGQILGSYNKRIISGEREPATKSPKMKRLMDKIPSLSQVPNLCSHQKGEGK